MREFLKYLYKSMLPKRMRPQIDLFPELRKLKHSRNILKEERVLVIAPHMDDETIACGGVMHRYVQQGANITIVIMTDGKKGNPSYEENELMNIRKAETKAAADIIGIKDIIFLDEPEGELKNTKLIRDKLYDIIKTIDPEAIYFPFCYDSHRDHVITSTIFLDVVRKKRISFNGYAYTVWSPIIPNLTVNITDDIEIKKRALEVFKTQIERFDLVDMTLSVSRHMGYLYGKWKGYSENFVVCSSIEHLRLARLIE